MSKWNVKTKSALQTEGLGHSIGLNLNGGEIIELVGDLGGGKTTLTKGLARGVGSESIVTSPTFTVSNLYSGDRLEIHHYDFYRLGEIGLMGDELQEVLGSNNNVVIVEWAGGASKLLPAERLARVEIEPVKEDESFRTVTIELPESMEYLVEGLEAEEC